MARKKLPLIALSVLLAVAVGGYLSSAEEHSPSPIGPLSARTGLLLTDNATIKLIQNSSGDVAERYDSHLSLWKRVEATPQYQEAAAWVAQKAKEVGLGQVNVTEFPSDGLARYYTYQTKRFWAVKKAELWMESPYKVRITSYSDLPFSICRDSTSTNVEAGLVDIGQGTRDEDYTQSVRGNIALTSGDPALVVDRAIYRYGALGIVSSWTVPEWDRLNRLPGDYPTLVGWRYLPDPINKPHGTFAFMISPQRAHELQAMLRSAVGIKLRAVVDASLQPGTFGVVSGVIPGSKFPYQEIDVTAHLDEIGADDNGSGSSALLEMARTLEYLIHSKQFPEPLRTIRFIWGPEFAGSYAWLSRHLNDPVARIADLNFDQVGGSLIKENAVFRITSTPDSNPSYLNAAMASILSFMNRYNDVRYPVEKELQIISVLGSRNRLQGIMTPFIAGSDHEIYDHLGIPGIFVTTWPENFYHSSEDTPDKVDPSQLHRSVFAGLAAMTVLAYANDTSALDIARLAMVYGERQVAADTARALDAVLSANREDFSERRWLADAIIQHAYLREEAAIRSSDVFAQTGQTRGSIEQTAVMLARQEGVAHRQARELAHSRAESLDVPVVETELSPAEKQAANLFPRRNKGERLFGANEVFAKLRSDPTAHIHVIQDALAEAVKSLRERGAEDLLTLAVSDAPAYYANGKRSILQISEDVAAEYAPIPIGVMMDYFRAFEKAGVMTLVRQ
jgi:hypothetical protein